jgi:hypothetical protein
MSAGVIPDFVFLFAVSTYCVSHLPTENQHYYHKGQFPESQNI